MRKSVVYLRDRKEAVVTEGKIWGILDFVKKFKFKLNNLGKHWGSLECEEWHNVSEVSEVNLAALWMIACRWPKVGGREPVVCWLQFKKSAWRVVLRYLVIGLIKWYAYVNAGGHIPDTWSHEHSIVHLGTEVVAGMGTATGQLDLLHLFGNYWSMRRTGLVW